MNSRPFFLFRLKLIRSAQRSLHHDSFTRPEIFLEVLKEKPSIELKNGQVWHLGNFTLADEHGGYFAVGRTTRATHERYDKETGDFLVEDLDTSPYTHVVFDARIGFLAIAKKAALARTPNGIANKVASLFSAAMVIEKNDIEVAIDPISDPFSFIDSLKSAYRVRRFGVSFSRSNPFDADEFFQQPMEKYLDSANGSKGTTVISGEDLNSTTLVEMTKSVAATGNKASASIQATDGTKFTTKRLGENQAQFTVSDEAGVDVASTLSNARETYSLVREGE